MFIGIYSFVASYCVGIDFGKEVGSKIGHYVHRHGPKISDFLVCLALFFCVVGFSIGVALDSTTPGKQVFLAALLVPFGSCIRAWLSRHKIKKLKLPLGTLIVNLAGSILLAGVHVINYRAAKPACADGGDAVCWPIVVTYAIGTGFCAALTTISTVMGEIYSLRSDHPRFAYFYIVLSVIFCQGFAAIINGVNLAFS